MPTVVQFRRGTTAQNNSFTGAVGEISVDTTLGTIRVHDGATTGGATVVNTTAAQTLTNKTIPYIPGTTVIGGTGNLVANATTTSTSTTTGALVVPNGGVGIGGNLYVGNNLVLGTVPILCGSSVTSTIATAPQAIDWFGSGAYRTAKYTISTTDVTNSWYQSVEIILVQDGTTSTITTYGLISTSGNTRMTFTSNIMSGNVILWATGVSANNTVKLDKKLIPV
jgi:hypothetical protein